MRRFLAILFTAALVLAGSRASATRQFPRAIQQDLALNAEPACAICHLDGVTARGSVVTPFGVAMRARGLVPNDSTSLANALDAMTQDRQDSVGDGVTDIARLKAGQDPNGQDYVPPVYGCGIGPGALSRSVSRQPIVGLLIIGLAGIAFRRRTRTQVNGC